MNTKLPEHLTADEGVEVTQEELNSPHPIRRIESAEEANRFAYALSETDREIRELNELAQAEIARWQAKIDSINKWHEGEVSPLLGKLSYLRQMLTNYHIEQYQSAPNDKARKKLGSIKLPYGVTLKSTQPAMNYDVVDEEAYKAYLEANGYLEKVVTEKPKWGEFKKTLKYNENGQVLSEDGEILEFMATKQSDRKFEVN